MQPEALNEDILSSSLNPENENKEDRENENEEDYDVQSESDSDLRSGLFEDNEAINWWSSKNPHAFPKGWIRVPDESYQFLLASNSEYISHNTRVAPFCKMDDGLLHLSYGNEMDKTEFVQAIQKLHDG